MPEYTREDEINLIAHELAHCIGYAHENHGGAAICRIEIEPTKARVFAFTVQSSGPQMIDDEQAGMASICAAAATTWALEGEHGGDPVQILRLAPAALYLAGSDGGRAQHDLAKVGDAFTPQVATLCMYWTAWAMRYKDALLNHAARIYDSGEWRTGNAINLIGNDLRLQYLGDPLAGNMMAILPSLLNSDDSLERIAHSLQHDPHQIPEQRAIVPEIAGPVH